MLEVLARAIWSFGGGCLWHQRLEGQITEVRWYGLVFYVRENLNGNDAFYITANERHGEKGGVTGYGRPTLARNILDVCTASDDQDWCLAADVVHTLDVLRRPVRKRRLFTSPLGRSHVGSGSHTQPTVHMVSTCPP